MSKGLDSKKSGKKDAAKTLKEKRAAKKVKKDEKKNQGFPKVWLDLNNEVWYILNNFGLFALINLLSEEEQRFL